MLYFLYIYRYIYTWRFRIKGGRPLSAGVVFLVLPGRGGFGRGGDKTGFCGPDGRHVKNTHGAPLAVHGTYRYECGGGSQNI